MPQAARKESSMSQFTWLLLGSISGSIASHLVNHRGEGMVLDVLLGIVGAMIGGWLAGFIGRAGVTALNMSVLSSRSPGRLAGWQSCFGTERCRRSGFR